MGLELVNEIVARRRSTLFRNVALGEVRGLLFRVIPARDR